MTIARWNPVRDMLQMREAMDRAFEDVYRGRTANGVPAWQLPLDAYVTDDALVLQANIPGLNANDVEVLLEGDTLTVRGEFKTAAEENKYLLHERATGKFERVLTINTPIDHAKVEANFDNGVLTLTLPKAEAVKPRQITIKPRPVQSAN